MIWQIISPLCILCILSLPSSIISGRQPAGPPGELPPHSAIPASNSTYPIVFTLQQLITGDEQTIDVHSANKVQFQIQREWHQTTPNSLSIFIRSRDGQNISVHAKSRDTFCWFSKTYKSSDGVEFHINNRLRGADRWVIKKGGPIKEDYTWHRAKKTLTGPLTSKNGTVVANIGAVWTNLYGTYQGWSYYVETISGTINSTGVVPDIYLLALYETAYIRQKVCLE